MNIVDIEIIKFFVSCRFWICMYCSNNLFLFTIIDDYKQNQTINQSNKHRGDRSDNCSGKTCSPLKPPENLINLLNNFKNVSSKQKRDTENIINCKYYTYDEIQTLNNLKHKGALFFFHMKTCSLPKNIEELEYLNDKTYYTLVTIFPRRDLCIYKFAELESTFIEILNSKKTNAIVGCIYRNPLTDFDEFNDYNLNDFWYKLSNENKNYFRFFGDFNVVLLKYEQYSPTNEFLISYDPDSNCTNIKNKK